MVVEQVVPELLQMFAVFQPVPTVYSPTLSEFQRELTNFLSFVLEPEPDRRDGVIAPEHVAVAGTLMYLPAVPQFSRTVAVILLFE